MVSSTGKTDLQWTKMLPPDYTWAVENAHGGAISFQSFKELYSHVCGHILVGDGLEGYGCDPTCGRMYRTFAARKLSISWGEDQRYWAWIPGSKVPGSRFGEVAYLNNVCWLELKGELKPRLLPGEYTLFWVFKFARTSKDVHIDHMDTSLRGWATPVHFTFTSGEGIQRSEIEFPPRAGEELVHWKVDNWFEYCAGNFIVEETDDGVPDSMQEVHLKFDMKQTVNSLWKNNLIVDGVIIYGDSRW